MRKTRIQKREYPLSSNNVVFYFDICIGSYLSKKTNNQKSLNMKPTYNSYITRMNIIRYTSGFHQAIKN